MSQLLVAEYHGPAVLGHGKSTTQSLGRKVYQHHLKELDLNVVSDASISVSLQ